MKSSNHSILEVGPVHAGIIEPGLFRFTLSGERVERVDIELGFQHRGIEQLIVNSHCALTRMCLAEQIAGDTTIGHAIAMAEILEGGARHPMIETERKVALEMERTAMNIADTAALCDDIGYQTGLVACEALRTMTINAMQRLCGNRFGRTLIRPAGSHYRIDLTRFEDIQSTLTQVARRFALVARDINSSPSCLSRFEDVCIMRTPCGRYSGDIAARLRMRFDQVAASITLISELGRQLGSMWYENHPNVRYDIGLTPNTTYQSSVDAWRGTISHRATTDANARIETYTIVDPSVELWKELASSMQGAAISDFPINNKSFNLSYCGVDL